MALGGKAFVTLTGPVAAAEAAVGAGAGGGGKKCFVGGTVGVTQPRQELLRELI
jgi:hypothetical protein